MLNENQLKDMKKFQNLGNRAKMLEMEVDRLIEATKDAECMTLPKSVIDHLFKS